MHIIVTITASKAHHRNDLYRISTYHDISSKCHCLIRSYHYITLSLHCKLCAFDAATVGLVGSKVHKYNGVRMVIPNYAVIISTYIVVISNYVDTYIHMEIIRMKCF